MKKVIILIIAIVLLGISGFLWMLAGNEELTPSESVPYEELPYTPPAAPEPVVMFDELVDTTPDAALESVLNLLYLDVYEEYVCEDLGTNERAILVTAKYTPNADGLNTLDEAKRAVTVWESSILADVGHLLFPQYEMGELDAPLTFASVPGTGMRSASTNVASTQVSIAYSWLLNYVVIATSLDCLEATMKEVYEYAI